MPEKVTPQRRSTGGPGANTGVSSDPFASPPAQSSPIGDPPAAPGPAPVMPTAPGQQAVMPPAPSPDPVMQPALEPGPVTPSTPSPAFVAPINAGYNGRDITMGMDRHLTGSPKRQREPPHAPDSPSKRMGGLQPEGRGSRAAATGSLMVNK